MADAVGLDALDEFAGDLEVHIGREESGAHLLEGLRHVFFGKFADAAQVAEGVAEFFGEGFEHGKAE